MYKELVYRNPELIMEISLMHSKDAQVLSSQSLVHFIICS